MKIIFLDIDGVLTTLRTKYHHGDTECVQRLNALTKETDSSIVVSSTWRKGGLRSIRQTLKTWGITAPIYGITPDLSAQRGELAIAVPRGREILAWLETHVSQSITHFVILDDSDDMEWLKPLLIQTDPYAGFQDSDLARALGAFKTCAWCTLRNPARRDGDGDVYHTLFENGWIRWKQQCARTRP